MCKGNPSRNFGWLDIEFNSLACLHYCLFWFSLWILSPPLAFKAMVVWVAYHNSLIDSQDFCKRIPFFLELILLYEYQSTQKVGEIELYYYWISKEERCCQRLHILPLIGHLLVIWVLTIARLHYTRHCCSMHDLYSKAVSTVHVESGAKLAAG